MALNFPSPATDGQTFTDPTGRQWVYETLNNSWTAKGGASGGMVYKGGLDITAAPPAGVQSGWLYVVTTGGTPNAGYTGITGTVPAGSQVVFGGPNWQLLSAPGPWARTGTELAPSNAGDSVFTSGAVKVGGTTAAPNITVKADGGIVANTNGLVYDAATKRLGLGTSSADNKLSVGIASADEGIELKATYNGARVARFAILNPGVDNTPYIGSLTSNDFGFIAGGTRRMTLDSTGRLGIGNTSPSYLLDCKSTGATNVARFLTGAVVSSEVAQFGRSDQAVNLSIDYDGAGAMGIGTTTAHPFLLKTGATEKARLDTSGRLLVGTSSAANADILSVQGQSGAGTVGRFRLSSSKATGTLSNNEQLTAIDFGSRAIDGETYASITSFVDGAPGSGSYPSRLAFSTTADGASSPTERMRINNGGTTNIYTANSYGLKVNNSAAAGTTYPTIWASRNATGIDTGTEVFYVWSNGNVQNTNGSYTTISDAKLKENIVDASSQWNDLKAIRIRNWNFKQETGHETHRQIGPIAQELEQVCPGLVFETLDRDEDGSETGEVTKGVNQSVLYMKAVKALQEAMERIETLEAKVAALEAS